MDCSLQTLLGMVLEGGMVTVGSCQLCGLEKQVTAAMVTWVWLS